MKYFLFIVCLFISISSQAAPAPPEGGGGGGNSIEYAVGGGYYIPAKDNDKNLEPEPGFTLKLQNGNGQANFFNLVSNLEFSISGDGHADFKDSDGNDVINVLYDYYTISYHLGFRFNLAPTSFILPYFGMSAVVSVATFQFAEQTSDAFPRVQRGFMYGGTLFTGFDFYFSGNKDNGWGFRFEGDVIRLYPYTDYTFGDPEIYAFNLNVMFVATY